MYHLKKVMGKKILANIYQNKPISLCSLFLLRNLEFMNREEVKLGTDSCFFSSVAQSALEK